jgi:hypothetical protein
LPTVNCIDADAGPFVESPLYVAPMVTPPNCEKLVLHTAAPDWTGTPAHPAIPLEPAVKSTVPPAPPMEIDAVIFTGCASCAAVAERVTTVAGFDTTNASVAAVELA